VIAAVSMAIFREGAATGEEVDAVLLFAEKSSLDKLL
jgi:hypothetical protein